MDMAKRAKPDNIRLSKNLKYLRAKSKLSQDEFSKLVFQASRNLYATWENAYVLPDERYLEMLEQYAGIDRDVLLYEDITRSKTASVLKEPEQGYSRRKLIDSSALAAELNDIKKRIEAIEAHLKLEK